MIDLIKLNIKNKIERLEVDLQDAIRYQRSSIVGQLIACNEILSMIKDIEDVEKRLR